jgi:succinate dehydrogenase/fumarate reductase cytochrome b subunit
VWTTRFSGHTFVFPAEGLVAGSGSATVAPETTGLVQALEPGRTSIYYFMVDKLSGNWPIAAVYLLGVASACFHFSNGMWTFCISWGITVGENAQKASRVLFSALGVVLFALGSGAVLKLVLTKIPGAL